MSLLFICAALALLLMLLVLVFLLARAQDGRRVAASVLLVLLAFAGAASAAGTVTSTEVRHTSVRKVTLAWTSSAGGAADGTTAAAFDGKLVGVTTIPSGVAAPTDDYDFTLADADGHDVLLGAGANRDTANTEHLAEAVLGAVAGSTLTLHVTNAGATKAGTVVVYIR